MLNKKLSEQAPRRRETIMPTEQDMIELEIAFRAERGRPDLEPRIADPHFGLGCPISIARINSE